MLKRLRYRLRRIFGPCPHQFYIEDITRVNDELVLGACVNCLHVFEAECGLHLPGELLQRQPHNGNGE